MRLGLAVAFEDSLGRHPVADESHYGGYRSYRGGTARRGQGADVNLNVQGVCDTWRVACASDTRVTWPP